jgi:hypothetical protein
MVKRQRRPRKKTTRNIKDDWEAIRKDAWLRELLTSSSEEEAKEKRTKLEEEKYRRFEESSRWLAEADFSDQGPSVKIRAKEAFVGKKETSEEWACQLQ